VRNVVANHGFFSCNLTNLRHCYRFLVLWVVCEEHPFCELGVLVGLSLRRQAFRSCCCVILGWYLI
jgi:hypothetical protein